jgi:hypothetical protein
MTDYDRVDHHISNRDLDTGVVIKSGGYTLNHNQNNRKRWAVVLANLKTLDTMKTVGNMDIVADETLDPQ